MNYSLVFLALITLHGPDGREIVVSVDEVTSMHCKMPGTENKLFVEGVNTVVHLTDGKGVNVSETCTEVKKIMEEAIK